MEDLHKLDFEKLEEDIKNDVTEDPMETERREKKIIELTKMVTDLEQNIEREQIPFKAFEIVINEIQKEIDYSFVLLEHKDGAVH